MWLLNIRKRNKEKGQMDADYRPNKNDCVTKVDRSTVPLLLRVKENICKYSTVHHADTKHQECRQEEVGWCCAIGATGAGKVNNMHHSSIPLSHTLVITNKAIIWGNIIYDHTRFLSYSRLHLQFLSPLLPNRMTVLLNLSSLTDWLYIIYVIIFVLRYAL